MKRLTFKIRNEQSLGRLYIAWVLTMMVFLAFLYFLVIGYEYQDKTIYELISR